jgi:hypothetical protein
MHTSLESVVARVCQSRHLRYADLCRLKRDLPNGLKIRAEAEALLSMDYALERADRSWPDYLSGLIADLCLVSGSRQLEFEAAEWLKTQLSTCRPATARHVSRTILREARDLDPNLRAALNGRSAQRAKRPAQRSTPLRWPPLGSALETHSETTQ